MIRYHPEIEEMFSRNKYHNKKIDTEDGKFDSMYEYQKWCELKLLEKNGEISNLKRQVKFNVIPQIKTQAGTLREINYIADFIFEKDGILYVADSKGIETPEYKIKKRLIIQNFRDGIWWNDELIFPVFMETKKGKPDKIYK